MCESKTADAVEWRISENFELYYNCKRLILGDGLGGQSYSVSEELQEVYYLADDYEDTPAGACDPLCSVDEMSSVEFEASYKPNSDFTKAVVIAGSMLAGAAIINHSWVAENQVRVRIFLVNKGLTALLEDTLVSSFALLHRIT